MFTLTWHSFCNVYQLFLDVRHCPCNRQQIHLESLPHASLPSTALFIPTINIASQIRTFQRNHPPCCRIMMIQVVNHFGGVFGSSSHTATLHICFLPLVVMHVSLTICALQLMSSAIWKSYIRNLMGDMVKLLNVMHPLFSLSIIFVSFEVS
jgi:hypothetical protein